MARATTTTYKCDWCGLSDEDPNKTVNNHLKLNLRHSQVRDWELCDSCADTAWKAIYDLKESVPTHS